MGEDMSELAAINTTPDEWVGDVHTLIVHEVTPPIGQFDDGELDYEVEHPESCKTEQCGEGEHAYVNYVCDVQSQIDGSGLAGNLKYSGTPITEPGTYRIQAWGNRRYVWDAWAYEYDGGIGVVEDVI